MAATTLTSPSSVADRLQAYFSKRLLEVQVQNTVMDQWAIKADLPMKAGKNTIRFFKPALSSAALKSAPTSNGIVEALTEATAPTNYRQNDWTNVTVTLKQYGAVTKISDLVSALDAFEPLNQNIDLMGRDAAVHTDTVIRNALIGGSGVHPDGSSSTLTHNSNGSGAELMVSAADTVAMPATSSTGFSTLSGLTKAQGKIFRGCVLAAVTRLRVNVAPKVGGRYICAISPQVVHDLVQDSDYELAFRGRGNDGVWKGFIADIDGVHFVEHTNPFIEDETYGTYDATDDNSDGLIYSTIFLGSGAYGCPKLAGTQSPLRPRIFVNDKPDKTDPLNQYLIAGWKAYYMAMGLDALNLVVLRTKSTWA